MTTELTKVSPTKMLEEVSSMNRLVAELKSTKHYAKFSDGEIMSVCLVATQLGVSPLLAINGDLYPCQGKVEMSARLMNRLIRQAGHSVRKDPASNDQVCILHGKRADTGDEWTESFSIKEAERAGLLKGGGAWAKYPRDMIFNRALSRLARQLFPDVIAGAYVEGEISAAPPLNDPIETIEVDQPPKISYSGPIGAMELERVLEKHPHKREELLQWLAQKNIHSFEKIPYPLFTRMKERLVDSLAEEVVTEEAADENESE